MPQDYENDMDLQDNIVFLNEKLKKDGYGFTVSLTFVPGEEENYYSRMLELLESGDTDIAFLGLDGEQEAMGPSEKLIRSGALLPLDEYLQSDKGQKLYQAFYDKVWETVAIDGTICAIPNQLGRDGTTFAAFNKKYFEEDITFDGSMQELADMLAQTDIPEDAVSLL